MRVLVIYRVISDFELDWNCVSKCYAGATPAGLGAYFDNQILRVKPWPSEAVAKGLFTPTARNVVPASFWLESSDVRYQLTMPEIIVFSVLKTTLASRQRHAGMARLAVF